MLSSDQIEFYRENGYLLVRALFTPEETKEFRQAAHELCDRLEKSGRNIDATWGSAQADRPVKIQHCHDAQFHSAAFSRLITDKRFGEAAADVMGTRNVQLHHTKVFIKPPEKGSPFPLHQDRPYFPHDKDTMIAAIVHLDDATSEKGCVRVVPGSHKLGQLPHQEQGGWHLDPAEHPLESAIELPAKAGDVLFFSYLTIHGSGINGSSEPRTTILVQMRDPEDPPTLAVHQSRGQGMMLHGIDPSASPHVGGT